MTKRTALVALVLVFLAACSTDTPAPTSTATPRSPEPTRVLEPTAEPTEVPAEPPPPPLPPTPTVTPEPPAEPAAPPAEPTLPPTEEPVALASHPGLPLPAERGDLFAGSGACGVCHTGLTDEAGADVSIDSFWRSTMMANAARDPYWQATVRTEVLKNPALQEIIEDKCATCHMPMARTTAAAGGGVGQVLDGGYLNPANELHTLGLDGVSCTLCHQIEPNSPASADSFSGGYPIDTETPAGERVNYGPFPVEEGSADLMRSASGYLPVESRHIGQATLCATCHTLYTPYLDADGAVAGEFPEQTAFLEWRASDYHQNRSCQNCHMPHAQGGVVLSVTGGDPRQPFSQHSFVGGNAFMVNALRIFAEERQVTAATEHFGATLARIQDQIGNRTASIALENVAVSGGELTAEVLITSQAGHKFPTGFPSRRAWLHVTVTDPGGVVIFESGAVAADGSISGNDNDADPAAYEPHYAAISDPDQVQIYESMMGDTEGQVTTTLLRGAGYLKDNRLLPTGLDKESAPADIAVYGEALEDPDFVAGGDRVQVRVSLGDAQGPFTVSAELLYQAIGYRWADNLRGFDAQEVVDFLRYYDAVPNTPLLVAGATAQVD
jgi:hypothetical protein